VPPFVTAHPEIFGFLKEYAHQYNYFCAVYDYVEKADLKQGLSESTKKIGGNRAFFRDN